MRIDLDHALDPATTVRRLTEQGMAVLTPDALRARIGPLDGLDALAPSWSNLPADPHLRDGGRYRYRRHGSLTCAPGERANLAAPRPHWQPTTYNALHGGMLRWFEPLEERMTQDKTWLTLVASLSELFAQVRPSACWFIEAHPFRITTEGGVGRPTPEGAHRDGVDFVAVIFVGRNSISGGETRVFEGAHGVRFTLTEPWSVLLLDDTRVIHESTPIQPAGEGSGWRDTLVLTFRSEGFQDPPKAA